MMGYLIPWNINTMSVFSLTLKLFEDGEYTHPGYQVRNISIDLKIMKLFPYG
jgi:hypothetical protein